MSLPTRPLGRTGLQLPILSFGASSLGQEFRSVSLDDALASVRVALEVGLNFIDTSPFYGRGMSEVLLGIALRGIPRESYLLCTKLGRYDLQHFDFSARRVAESVDVSLHRLGTDHLDIVLFHDIEFVPMQQIVDDTLPALRRLVQAGKVRFIGFSGYPQKIFRFIGDQFPVDCVLNYNQYTLQNTRFADETIPYLQSKGIGVMNAGPFSARLLTQAPSQPGSEPEEVKAAAGAAALCVHVVASTVAQLALQFSCANPDITTIAGSANQPTSGAGRTGSANHRHRAARGGAAAVCTGQEHRPPGRAARKQLTLGLPDPASDIHLRQGFDSSSQNAEAVRISGTGPASARRFGIPGGHRIPAQQGELHGIHQRLEGSADDILAHSHRSPFPVAVGGLDEHTGLGSRSRHAIQDTDLVIRQPNRLELRKRAG